MSCLNKLVIPQEIGPHAAEEFELVMFRNNKSVKNGPYVPYILYTYRYICISTYIIFV